MHSRTVLWQESSDNLKGGTIT